MRYQVYFEGRPTFLQRDTLARIMLFVVGQRSVDVVDTETGEIVYHTNDQGVEIWD